MPNPELDRFVFSERQAPSLLAVMLFLHPRELRNIRMDRSLKRAVIDSLKLKQMFWPVPVA